MNIRKVAIRAGLVLIGLPIVLVLILFGFFYSVSYFPNWTTATTGTIISSGQKREYLLYVPKGYDRAKPTPVGSSGVGRVGHEKKEVDSRRDVRVVHSYL